MILYSLVPRHCAFVLTNTFRVLIMVSLYELQMETRICARVHVLRPHLSTTWSAWIPELACESRLPCQRLDGISDQKTSQPPLQEATR